jgi:hypothetical protein
VPLEICFFAAAAGLVVVACVVGAIFRAVLLLDGILKETTRAAAELSRIADGATRPT